MGQVAPDPGGTPSLYHRGMNFDRPDASPPAPSAAALLPAASDTVPPVVPSPAPALIEMSPPAPVADEPVDTDTLPDKRVATAPEPTTTEPLLLDRPLRAE